MDDKVKLASHVHDMVAAGIAITVMLGVVISSTFILVWAIPEGNETLVGQMQGSLWTALGMLVTYYFGSNRAITAKDETISTLVNTAGRAEESRAPSGPPPIPVEVGEKVTVKGVNSD